jgi:hypothetical protein
MQEDMKSRYIQGMPATIPPATCRHRVSNIKTNRPLKYIKLHFFLLYMGAALDLAY